MWRRAFVPLLARRYRRRLRDVERFCFMLGYARSGTTLVGQLLNAHHSVVIANEAPGVRFFGQVDSQAELFALLVRWAKGNAERGFRGGGGYHYVIPGSWQGRTDGIRVVGYKKVVRATAALGRDTALIDRIRSMVTVPLRVIHVIRDPFDTIATSARHEDIPLREMVDQYFAHCELAAVARTRFTPEELVDVRHEDLIADPRRSSPACAHTSGSTPPTAISTCARRSCSASRAGRGPGGVAARGRRRGPAPDRGHRLPGRLRGLDPVALDG